MFQYKPSDPHPYAKLTPSSGSVADTFLGKVFLYGLTPDPAFERSSLVMSSYQPSYGQSEQEALRRLRDSGQRAWSSTFRSSTSDRGIEKGYLIPLAEILEGSGVDGNGSFPLYSFSQYNGSSLVKFVRRGLRCYREQLGLEQEFQYPGLPTPEKGQDVFSYDEVMTDLATVLQIFDFYANRFNFSAPLPKNRTDDYSFYMNLASQGKMYPLRSLLCFDFSDKGMELGSMLSRPPINPETYPSPTPPSNTSDTTTNLTDFLDTSFLSEKAKSQMKAFKEALLPDSQVEDIMRLVYSPETNGDLSDLSEMPFLIQCRQRLQQLLVWLSQKTPPRNATQLQGLNRALSTDSDRWYCTSRFCRLLKGVDQESVFEWVRRTVSIIALQYCPDYIWSMFSALNLTGSMFAMTAGLGFLCFDALMAFQKDRLLFNYETSKGLYSPFAFFISKNCLDIPFQLLLGIILASLWGGMSGAASTVPQFFVMLVIAAMTCYAAYGFCYFVSAICSSVEVSMVLASFLLLLWIILAGFILRDDSDIPRSAVWLRHISLHRFGWFSFMANRFQNGFGPLPESMILYLMGVSKTNIRILVLYNFIIGTVFRILAFFGLLILYRNKGVLAS